MILMEKIAIHIFNMIKFHEAIAEKIYGQTSHFTLIVYYHMPEASAPSLSIQFIDQENEKASFKPH